MARTEETTTVHIRKDIGHIAHIYCVFNQVRMQDFVSDVLEKHLKEFEGKLGDLRRLR